MPIKIERELDLDAIRSGHEAIVAEFEEKFENISESYDADLMFLLGANASDVLASHNALGSNLATQADYLKITSRALTSFFVRAANLGKTIRTKLRDKAITLESDCYEIMVSPTHWLETYFFNLITRDTKANTILCKIPLNLLDECCEEAPQHFLFAAQAIQEMMARKPEAQRTLKAAMAGTVAPDRDDEETETGTHLWHPAYQCLQAMLTRSSDDLTEALSRGAQRHKEYYISDEERQRDSNGYFSLPLTAIASLAHDLKIPFDVESDFIPTTFVSGEIIKHFV